MGIPSWAGAEYRSDRPHPRRACGAEIASVRCRSPSGGSPSGPGAGPPEGSPGGGPCMRLRSPVAAAFALALMTSGCGSGSDPVIGVLLPMSGDTATYGEESWNGMRIAYDEIRANDSSFGLKLVLADEQSRKDQVGPQTKKLVENDGARIVVGSVASSNTMEAALVCKNAGVPLLTPASTNDKLTDDPGTYGTDVFRVCFKDSLQGSVLARFANGTLKAKRAVAVVDEGQAYARGLADNFEKEFVRLGGSVEREYYSSKDLEYKTLVQ